MKLPTTIKFLAPAIRMSLYIALVASIPAFTGCNQEEAVAVAVSSDSQSTPSPDTAAGSPEAAATSEAGKSEDEPEQIGAPEPKSRPRSTFRKGGVRDITFDDLEFKMEPDEDYLPEMLTDEIRKLDGKKVILRGFMEASTIFQRVGIKEFVLVRDNQICCFGPGAKIYHNVWINMEGDASAKFPGLQPLQVEGEFSIRPWKNPGDGKVYSVFHIQATKAKK